LAAYLQENCCALGGSATPDRAAGRN